MRISKMVIVVRNIFLFLVYSIFIGAITGCLPSPDQDEDAIAALSLDTTSPNQQNEDTNPSQAVQDSPQAQNTNPIFNLTPNKLFVCQKGQDVATVTLYFYEPDKNDENKMICSFVFYERVDEQKKPDQYTETNWHIEAPVDEICIEKAKEKLGIHKATGWKCPEKKLL